MFLEDRSQEGKKFLDLLRVLLNGYILAELLHKFHVVHECPHLPGQGRENSPMVGGDSGIQESLY